MSSREARIERRLQISGALIALGLLVELVTLIWSHPTAFLLFLLPGGSLMAAGILTYLFSLVAGGRSAIGGDRTSAVKAKGTAKGV